MIVNLVDGTYELFRHYYALPSVRDQEGREIAAVRGVLSSVLGMIREGATAFLMRSLARECLGWVDVTRRRREEDACCTGY